MISREEIDNCVSLVHGASVFKRVAEQAKLAISLSEQVETCYAKMRRDQYAINKLKVDHEETHVSVYQRLREAQAQIEDLKDTARLACDNGDAAWARVKLLEADRDHWKAKAEVEASYPHAFMSASFQAENAVLTQQLAQRDIELQHWKTQVEGLETKVKNLTSATDDLVTHNHRLSHKVAYLEEETKDCTMVKENCELKKLVDRYEHERQFPDDWRVPYGKVHVDGLIAERDRLKKELEGWSTRRERTLAEVRKLGEQGLRVVDALWSE